MRCCCAAPLIREYRDIRQARRIVARMLKAGVTFSKNIFIERLPNNLTPFGNFGRQSYVHLPEIFSRMFSRNMEGGDVRMLSIPLTVTRSLLHRIGVTRIGVKTRMARNQTPFMWSMIDSLGSLG